uniref:Uncharacterized protein n=1 Tax=Oryza punctata TaxID=4537 RepID=A0A0E0KEZ6_ORYPU
MSTRVECSCEPRAGDAKMPRVDKRKIVGKAVVISSDESHEDDSDSSEHYYDSVFDESENDKAKKAKGFVKSGGSFSWFSTKYFSEVVSSLSPHQRPIFHHYVFKNLLLFDSSNVPKKFAAWIASKVDLKTSEVIFKDRVIRVLYLDTVDFGERNVSIGFPRMAVWKQGMRNRYSDFDKIDDDNFGLRPPKAICATSNSQFKCAVSFLGKLLI